MTKRAFYDSQSTAHTHIHIWTRREQTADGKRQTLIGKKNACLSAIDLDDRDDDDDDDDEGRESNKKKRE